MKYYTIGKFAKLTGLSTKTLIWYDNIGLLKPDKVNEINGYRYYTKESVKKVFAIKFLQSMDFSINQIMQFSKDDIKNKIKQLHDKISFINMNTLFLNNFIKNNQNEFKLEIKDKKVLSGKWHYQKSTENFEEAIISFNGDKVKNIPKYLFFGNNIGTDTFNKFIFTNNHIVLDDRKIDILLINNDSKLIVYQLNAEKNKIEYHVYFRIFKNQTYTDSEIELLFEKQKSKIVKDNAINFNLVEFNNEKLQGQWKLLGEIKESNLNDFDKKDISKILIQIWSPAFKQLSVYNNNVDVLPTNEKYIFFDKMYKANDLKCSILKSMNNNKQYLYFELFNLYYELVYFEKDRKAYICLNVDNELNIDEKLYIYERNDDS